MKVAFFIGHHKTGSTSLQNYLANSYQTLLRQGILYPAVEAEGMASNMAAVLAGKDAKIDINQFNVREPHNALAFQMMHEATEDAVPPWHPNLPTGFQMLHLIEQQITTLEPSQVVICSEVMSRFADRRMRKIMPRMAFRFGSYDVSIVLNLRRIDEYLSSWHLQRLKFGATSKPLRDGAYEGYYPNVHFRYDRIVETWRSTFPNAEMVVRNYDDVCTSGGTVADFFMQAKIDHVPVPMQDRMNASIPYAMAEIARLGNVIAPSLRHPLQAYLEEAATRVTYARNAEVDLFGEAHRSALIKAFEPVHASLSTQLGLDAFFPDLDMAAKPRDIPELEAARAALDALQKDAPSYAAHEGVRDFIANFEFET